MRCTTGMRFLLVPLLMATFAGVGATGGQQASPRPVVVLVHGRGHVDDDTVELRRIWKRDLDSALSLVGVPRLPDGDLRIAWYADILDPDFESSCGRDNSGSDSVGLESFARGFFSALASALPKSEAPEARSLLGDVLYAVDASKRCAAERRVGSAIEAAAKELRPIVVVAYSLGALIAYDYLNARAESATPIAALRFVTIGSPLGVPEIREILGHGSESLRVPKGVSAWENVFDPDDTFAAAISASEIGKGVRDVRTRAAAASDAHHIGRYLRDPATGAAVARAMCAADRQLAAACAKL
jgi:hypothetical protein